MDIEYYDKKYELSNEFLRLKQKCKDVEFNNQNWLQFVDDLSQIFSVHDWPQLSLKIDVIDCQ